jgi:signal transduction histidine kinase
VISALLSLRNGRLLPVVAALVCFIAIADRAVGNRMSLGVLYVLPMMLGAVVLSPVQIVLTATLCSLLRSAFDLPSPYIEMLLRFIFALIAYSACGLMVAGLIRNRQVAVAHLEKIGREQALRREAEEQLKTLAESSPAAILTVDGEGIVIAANHAASGMFALPDGESLKGRSIARYLPVLSDALQVGIESGGLKAEAQCQGRRDNGEIFLANTWFSSYYVDAGYMNAGASGKRLAAIVVDSSEEMRENEEENLRQLMRSNLIAASAVSHEVRNLCSAISVVSVNLREKHGLALDEEFQAMESLVHGLEKVASIGLRTNNPMAGAGLDDVQDLPLQMVLDDLRIVIEPDWREIDGAIHWHVPAVRPRILAEKHGLLQVFLNLAQNSHRAVQATAVRELQISVEIDERRAMVRFRDSGPGIAVPERLFEAFQPGADGSGLGLFISRAVVRGYGGDLRYEPQLPRSGGGSCFTVELQIVPADAPTSDELSMTEEHSAAW